MSRFMFFNHPHKTAHKPPFSTYTTLPFWGCPAERYYFDTGASDLIIKREVQLKHGSVTGAMVNCVYDPTKEKLAGGWQ